ncbi:MAG TPA: hypothetical protein VGO61_17360 [Steroidobacteraceae bacterium]|jgi:hypothetical protein|nr:hypothetical protein [Steroidobacteraceae bacterium]
MRQIFGAVVAIGVAGVAAIAATSAFLNSPLHIGPPPSDKPSTTVPTPPDDTGKPSGSEGGDRPKPADIPDAPSRGGTSVPDAPQPDASKPEASKPDGAKPDGSKPVVADGQAADDDKDDKDPYEGIAPEDLPPDLQYSADSNVSFPTNT